MNGLDFHDDMVVREDTSPIEQMFSEGARVFGLSEERQHNISICRKVYNDTSRFLTFIFPPIIGTFFDKIHGFFKDKETKFPRIDEGTSWLKEFLIRTPGNNLTNDFAIAMAMASEQELEKFRHILFLIHFWKEAPECIGTIPSEDEFTITKKPEGSMHIASKSNASAHYMRLANHYFHSLVGDNKRTYTLFIRMKGSDDVINYNMNGNSASGNTQLLPAGITEDGSLEAIENYIIIGGHILTQGIADIVPIYRLIDKHWGSIDAVINFLRLKRCSFFDTPNARKYIEKKRKETHAEVSAGIGKTRHRTRKVQGQKTVPLPVRSTGVVHRKKESPNFENFVYPVPEITGSFSTDLSRGKTWNGMRNKLCTNIPHSKETILWVFEPNEDGSNSWKPYSDAEVVKFSYIQDFTYRFCLISNTEKVVEPPENSEKNPISTVIVNKRLEITQDGLRGVQGGVARVLSEGNSTETDDRDARAFAYAEDIFYAIKYGNYRIDGNSIRLEPKDIRFFHQGKQLDIEISGISLTREEKETILTLISDDIFKIFSATETVQKENEVLEQLRSLTAINRQVVRWRNQFLDKNDPTKGGDIWQTIREHRVGKGYFGAALLQPWGNEIKTRIEKSHGDFSLRLEKVGSELGVSLIKNDGTTLATLISKDAQNAPYELNFPEDYDVRVYNKIFNILVTTLAFCGLVGARQVSDEGGGKTLSPPEVCTALDYFPTREDLAKKSSELSTSRDLIKEAEARFRAGNGKISLTDGYKPDGLYYADIHSKQGASLLDTKNSDGDLGIVLVDEKVSSVPKGKKGDPRIYERIERIPRLQKYVLIRAAVTASEYSKTIIDTKLEDAFSKRKKEVFENFWKEIPEFEQIKFFIRAVGASVNADNKARITAKLDETLEQGMKAMFEGFWTDPETAHIVLAAVKASEYAKVKIDTKGKEPFSNGMKDIFEDLWKEIPEDQQKAFLAFFQEGGDGVEGALNFEFDGAPFIKTILRRWEHASVQIAYLRPKIIPLEYMNVSIAALNLHNKIIALAKTYN